MKISIRHVTRYEYSKAVRLGEHRLMLRPKEGAGLQLIDFELRLRPEGKIRWGMDVFGNWVTWVSFSDCVSELEVVSESKIFLQADKTSDVVLEPDAVMFPFAYDAQEQQDLQPYLELAYPKDRVVLRQWLSHLWRPTQKIASLDLLSLLNETIYGNFSYQRRDEMGVQSPADTLHRRTGSCRDFAVLMIEACRILGLAARFVSGYMISADATCVEHASTHAWGEVYLPGAGWIGVDPTIGSWSNHCHIPLAMTRDALQAAPVRGVFAGDAAAFMGLYVDVEIRVLNV